MDSVTSLKSALLDSATRPAVVTDLTELVDSEVGKKGIAVKSGYALVKKIKPGIIGAAIDSLLDEFVEQLEPFHADFASAGGGSFGDYLAGRSDEVSDALLTVTDARAERSQRDSIKKVYGKLRPQGKKNVEEALPALGALIQKYTG